jgi:hypothetical protein
LAVSPFLELVTKELAHNVNLAVHHNPLSFFCTTTRGFVATR